MIKLEINGYEFPFKTPKEALTFIKNNGIKNKVKIKDHEDEIISLNTLNDIVLGNDTDKKV